MFYMVLMRSMLPLKVIPLGIMTWVPPVSYVDAVASAVEAYGTVEVVYHSTGASNLRAKELTQVVMIADQVGHV